MQATPALNRNRPNRAWLNIAVAALTVLLASCSGNGVLGHRAPRVAGPAGTPRTQAIGPKELAAARGQLAGLDTPPGLDSATFAQLKAELERLIEARASGKGASVLPNSTRNFPPDLAFADDGAGGFTMTWSYTNAGDYDVNGEVNVADLTPIGANFHATPSSPNWAAAQTADGDRNGEVNIADVTPIGAGLFSQALGYNVYGSADQAGPWTFVTGIPLSSAASGFPRKFSYPIPSTGAYAWYTVSPYDSTGADWLNGGGGGGNDGGATFTPGTVTAGPSATIGAGGGSLDGPAGTPIAGVHVDIPPGALHADHQFTLGYSDGTVTPAAGTWSGVVLDISAGQDIVFDAPVLITAPFTGSATDVPVPYYITPANELEDCQLVNLNRGAGTFTFMTLHASPYTWLTGNDSDISSDYSAPGFTPAKFGFQIVNWGSTYNGSGECMGMSAFAQWYYRYHRDDGDFYPRFMNVLGNDSKGNPVTGQDAIATRAFDSVSAMWEEYLPSIDFNTNDQDEWTIIRNAIRNNAAPTLLYIRRVNKSGPHSILAYGWTSNQLHIYNPNAPGVDQNLTYTGGVFTGFGGGYTEFRNNGMGSLQRENFSQILGDAEGNFSGTTGAFIHDLNVNDGDHITQRDLTLTGTVDSSQVLVEELWVNTGLAVVRTPVDPVLHTFTVTVPLQSGDNYLQLRTRGRNAGDNWFIIPNNFTNTRGLYVIGDIDVTTVLVTLSWDQPVDLDLYVTDPSSNTAWYQNQTTADGGELDVDNTSGYGPEHFTLTSTDTTQFGQPYILKVHKYSSGDQFTSWTMKVSLNEGPPQTYTGTLTSGDPSNNDPSGTGSDWGGFIEITPVQPGT